MPTELQTATLGNSQNRDWLVCCATLPMDRLPFEPDDLRASPTDRSLTIRSTPGRRLDKEERAFNRALARLQALSRALEEEKRRLNRLLVFHAAEIRPRTEQAVALRAGLVRALAPFLDDRRLTKAQRRQAETATREDGTCCRGAGPPAGATAEGQPWDRLPAARQGAASGPRTRRSGT